MQMKISVTRKKGDVDFKDFQAFAKALKKRSVTIGVHKAEGNKTNEISGTKVIDYACYNEFGNGNNPPARPFVRVKEDRKLREDIKAKERSTLEKFAQNKFADNKVSMVQELYGEVGKLYLKEITNRLEDSLNYFPENKPSTVRQKGFNHPLIDTTLLGNSLKAKIRVGESDSVEKVISTDKFNPIASITRKGNRN